MLGAAFESARSLTGACYGIITTIDDTGAPSSPASAPSSGGKWPTSDKSPNCAKAIVNRVWSYFFGRGIIDPADNIRGSNPPINPAPLDALEADFVASGFDLQHQIRTIVSSRTYQAATETNDWNATGEINFSHFQPVG